MCFTPLRRVNRAVAPTTSACTSPSSFLRNSTMLSTSHVRRSSDHFLSWCHTHKSRSSPRTTEYALTRQAIIWERRSHHARAVLVQQGCRVRPVVIRCRAPWPAYPFCLRGSLMIVVSHNAESGQRGMVTRRDRASSCWPGCNDGNLRHASDQCRCSCVQRYSTSFALSIST